ncbi:hypothetical protein [Dyella sp. AD56]|uniref:hypothetical protein n=1 Tax=Dyella sp. AD56 TaxID=1528744 RepID=UPI0011AFAFF9|nr:hypothetical protein [Dyella sp. AD56]
MSLDLLRLDELPEWFLYPEDFLQVVQSGLRDIGPWQILDGNWLRVRYDGMRKRFPERELVPFARRLDSDDVACWDRKTLPSVQVVHDFCSPGWEERGSHLSFKAWLLAVQEEAREFDA